MADSSTRDESEGGRGTKSDNRSTMGTNKSGISPTGPGTRAWEAAGEATLLAEEDVLWKPSSNTHSVSRRAPSSSALRVSLVTSAQSNGHGSDLTGTYIGGGCRQLLASHELPRLSGRTRYSYASPVTQPLPVQPEIPPSGADARDDGGIEPAIGRPRHYALVSSITGPGPLLDKASSSVQSLLNADLPHFASDGALSAPTLPLQRLQELNISSSGDHASGMHDKLVLILGRPSMSRLLRSERSTIKSEAVVVKWIRSVLLCSGSMRARNGKCDHGDECPTCGKPRNRLKSHIDDDLLQNIDFLMTHPAFVDHKYSAKDLGSVQKVFAHLHGLSPSSLPKGLTMSERRHVDFEAGRLIRRLSHLRSPSKTFGPAISVLGPAAVEASRSDDTVKNSGEVNSWPLAFHIMLEGILRDAEDMALMIPYQVIRRHFRRLRYFLDAITVPRLVILDAAHDWNIMAERISYNHGVRIKPKATPPTETLDESKDSDEDEPYKIPSDRDHSTGIRVTGLRDWSNCIFGDPLMAMVFSDKPSREFLRGFSGRPRRRAADHNPEDDEDSDPLCMYGDVVEYPHEAHVRLLLYQCYHATVAVVKEFYRPRSDSTSREFAARKRLSAVLARLGDVEDHPKRSHVRPSGEMSPSKRPKTESTDGDVPAGRWE